MQQDAQRLGRQILTKETELDTLFSARCADDSAARTLLNEIGQLQGELRFIHVNAHLPTAQLLSPEQIAAYDCIRGYTGGNTSTHLHHH